ncbi:organic cation transporter protein-like [Antedon mediterranea]|uniref:organic cation transporter protein-like n=1 Tax=Antedon mediterranea TaxID=105859 RepID=UPI003AF6D8A6
MDIDECLKKIGGFGRYQVILLIVAPIIQGVFTSWQIMSSIFILYTPSHHCKTDEKIDVAIPIEEDGTFAKCSMYTFDGNETTSCVDGWVYEESDKVTSLVTEFDLVCDQAILSPNAISIFFCGVLAGAVITGQLSDLFGRKTVTWLCMMGTIVCGIILVFIHSYIAFVIVWFFLANFVMGQLTCSFILLLELFRPKQRSLACCIATTAWGFGLCVLTPIAYLLQNWRHFQLAITLPMIPALLFWWFLVESPRWLQSVGRHEDARRVLEKMARFNRVDCSFLEEESKQEKNPGSHAKKYSVFDTVRTPNLRRWTLVLFFMWTVNSSVYYGLSLNSSALAGDRFLNFFIIGLAEVPAYIVQIWALPRFGRRQLLLFFHILASVACIMTIVIPVETSNGTNLTPLIITMAFIGKFCITLTYTVVWIYSSELFPTVIRTIGIGECSMMARIGGISAPYIMYSGKSVSWVPMVLFAVLSAIAGLIMLLLPETLNRPLPESIEDGENIRNTPLVTSAYSIAPNEDDNENTKV